MKAKVVILLSVIICICAYFISPKNTLAVVNAVLTFFQISENTDGHDSSTHLRVFSKEELAKFKGENGGSIYLALVGNVYDVSSGRKHYGPGGGYEFFAGKDGSKAYVTGNFNKDGLVDDISELKLSEILALEHWKLFYEKDYTLIGKVEGAFYDKNGAELPMLDVYRKKLEIANLEKDIIENDNRLFPPCNSEWSQAANAGRVWCTTKSGGILRDWVGVPRMYYVAGSSKPRCACVRTTGPPSHDPDSSNNRGDLDNPNLSPYPHCSEISSSCPMPQ